MLLAQAGHHGGVGSPQPGSAGCILGAGCGEESNAVRLALCHSSCAATVLAGGTGPQSPTISTTHHPCALELA